MPRAVRRRGAARRTEIDRRILALRPMFGTIEERLARLRPPRLHVGPTYMDGRRFDDGRERIRRGAVWFVGGTNTGFHVDFVTDGVLIQAWSAERRVCLEIEGKVTSQTLRRDLAVVLAGAGLLRLVGVEEAHRQAVPPV